MVREIVKSAGNTYLLNLPDDMLGKTVEVIAFEINADRLTTNPNESLIDIQKRYSKYPLVSHEGYRFNRDEANDNE
jgi:hypothetical protein